MRHLNKVTRRRIGLVGGFALFLGLLVVAALVFLWFGLADYQSSLPKNHAEPILNAYRSGDVKTILECGGNLPEELENPVLFAKYYAENTNLDELYFYQGATGNPDEMAFEFAAGSDVIATLTLQKSAGKSRFGFALYEIKSLIGYPLIEYTITAPPGTALFANGRLLDERYRSGTQGDSDSVSSLTGAAYRMDTYEVNDFLYIAELEAISNDDCKCTISWSADGRTATVGKGISEEERGAVTAFAEQFSEVYSEFATRRDSSRAPVMWLLYPGTPFHNAILLYNNDWGQIYVGDRYENRVIDQVTRYTSTEFSCNIRFDYVIRFQNGLEKTYPISMTYCLTNRTGKLLLVDMQNL